MVSVGEIGVLLGGIAALIGVFWTMYTGVKNGKKLKNLSDVVKPMYKLLYQQKSAIQELKRPATDVPVLPKPVAPMAGDWADQNLKRQELDLRQRELSWKQAEGAAKTLGWIYTWLKEGEEEDEDDY
jgi:hypothetical protein